MRLQRWTYAANRVDTDEPRSVGHCRRSRLCRRSGLTPKAQLQLGIDSDVASKRLIGPLKPKTHHRHWQRVQCAHSEVGAADFAPKVLLMLLGLCRVCAVSRRSRTTSLRPTAEAKPAAVSEGGLVAKRPVAGLSPVCRKGAFFLGGLHACDTCM